MVEPGLSKDRGLNQGLYDRATQCSGCERLQILQAGSRNSWVLIGIWQWRPDEDSNLRPSP